MLQNLLMMFSLLGKKGKTKWKPVETAQIINPNAPRKLATSSWADETNDIEGKHYQIRLIRITYYNMIFILVLFIFNDTYLYETHIV